ncbi:hypothetical protein EFM1CSP_07690 [Enterococcus faecium]|nr:hypothetical protein EFM1CSP_07690 [Enterococcus faecium]
MREKRAFYINGYAGIVGLIVLALVGLFFFYLGMWQAKVWALFFKYFSLVDHVIVVKFGNCSQS